MHTTAQGPKEHKSSGTRVHFPEEETLRQKPQGHPPIVLHEEPAHRGDEEWVSGDAEEDYPEEMGRTSVQPIVIQMSPASSHPHIPPLPQDVTPKAGQTSTFTQHSKPPTTSTTQGAVPKPQATPASSKPKGPPIVLKSSPATLSWVNMVRGRVRMIRVEDDDGVEGQDVASSSNARGNPRANLLATALGMLSPLMLQQQAPPTFNGRPQSWVSYRRLMEQWLNIMDPHRTANDAILFQSLRKTLDRTSKLELDAKLVQDPETRFWDYWEDLKDKFEDELEFYNRQAWSKIRLDMEGGELTYNAWRAFQAQYLRASTLVLDRNPQEEREKIFQQLPSEWWQRIINEESKRRGRQLWVRVSGHGLTQDDLRSLVAGIWDDTTLMEVFPTDLVGTF